jgi:DNA-3-methyladenine glycosylase
MTNSGPLGPGFYESDTVQIAKNLLGCILVHDSIEGRTSGRIVETEAYLWNDPACHASRGITPRTEVMFGPPGHAYIYLIYGMYRCFNVVTARLGLGEAVLIRALEPIEGLKLMAHRRGKYDPLSLCSGPGKLVMAMGLKQEQNGLDLSRGNLRILGSDLGKSAGQIKATTRIGIRVGVELPLRFYIEGNPFISKK